MLLILSYYDASALSLSLFLSLFLSLSLSFSLFFALLLQIFFLSVSSSSLINKNSEEKEKFNLVSSSHQVSFFFVLFLSRFSHHRFSSPLTTHTQNAHFRKKKKTEERESVLQKKNRRDRNTLSFFSLLVLLRRCLSRV